MNPKGPVRTRVAALEFGRRSATARNNGVMTVEAPLWEAMEKMAYIQADRLRNAICERVTSQEALNIQEEVLERNGISMWGRLLRWTKKNAVGLTGITASVAGIVTSVIFFTRNSAKSVAKAIGGLSTAAAAAALATLAAAAGGPMMRAVYNALAQILSWLVSLLGYGVGAITWFANNLIWVVPVIIVGIITIINGSTRNRT